MAGKKDRSKRDKASLISPPESALDKQDDKVGGENGQQGVSEDLRVYLPGMELAEGEELQVDPSAYVMLHEMSAEWPCLSFDVISDGNALERTCFPMSGYLVTGSQCDQRVGSGSKKAKNELYLLRYTNLHRTQEKSPDAEEESDEEGDGEGDNSDGDDSEDEETVARKNPRHYCLAAPHDGAVNRVRSIWSSPINSNERRLLAASWSDTGRVHLWDLTAGYQELERIDLQSPSSLSKHPALGPFASLKCHRTEGYALAWSPISGTSAVHLLSGDCQGVIHLTDVSPAGEAVTVTASEPFQAHTGSVEDLQWSPSEATVFASSSVDGTVRIWDVRMPRTTAALTGQVHPCDVNVVSWNAPTNHLLATGADDGVFATWDLRTWSSSAAGQNHDGSSSLTPVYSSNWHQGPITSIEWSPHDPAILAVAGADDQATIWDLSIEGSTAENVGEESLMTQDGRPVPKQLLFIHQGQKEIKELHWNAHLSGVLLTTALTGFNIFKTISV